jgi:hypothetical protein
MVQKKQYACLEKLGMVKDAELILLNSLEAVTTSPEFSAKERIATRVDLILHLIHNQKLEASPKRLIMLSKELIKDPDMKEIENNQAAFCHLVVGLAFFLSQEIPYIDVKTHLKYSLVLAHDKP